MNTPNHPDDEDILYLREGGPQAVADLYSKYRPQLERMVEFRMDRRLLGRVDAADVLQDSYMEIARRVESFLEDPAVSFFVWARQITWQTLMMSHRSHLGVQKRDARQEVRLHGGGYSQGTSVSLASRLVGDVTSPSQGAIRDEQTQQLREALDSMDSVDREVLALRHFEQLSNKEVAEVLNLGKTAASNRYVRALERLKKIMDETLGT
ncbi:sigma-70 family RNA polymerase sigma factor [Mariniblastus fucicola]|uniref:ECF RNA polymerase sigma factor SigW n=1 Tax=Mariniblastus fucicola TaxID=980251 RepID=A0A5B9PFN0_9BACT|nr:sigma-70 family RNA polymerase sigma factor [Mariniblastus fucicola]QEG25094.1 ECF RNA polymerase sigma factor SigW [Mariniblastus fucicola]